MPHRDAIIAFDNFTYVKPFNQPPPAWDIPLLKKLVDE